MPDATAQASGRWVKMSLDLLRDHHCSVVVEITMRPSADHGQDARTFKQTGYRTEVTAVATPPQLSLIGTLIRYISQVETQGEGR